MSWHQLNEAQLNILDEYIVEYDLAEEHRVIAVKKRKHLAAWLDIYNGTEVHRMAMDRKKFVENDPYARAIADKDKDELKWLEARRSGVTATEVSKLAQGRPGERAKMLAEKLTGERTFFGNKYTAWGLERESTIAAAIFRDYGILGSDVLFHAPGEIRHLATPDGVKMDENGIVTIAEIKTGKYDLDPELAHFKSTTYLDQMQWQMYVMGDTCKKCLFVWEQHDDNWVTGEDGIERPTPLEQKSVWIDRDQKRIDHLILLADAFLEEVEWEAA